MAFDKNRALDGDRYNNGPTALKAEHLDGSNAAVLTVTDVDEATFDDPDSPNGKRYVLVLKSAEFPEKGFFLNKTSRKIMTERYGDVPGRWINKKVPIVVVRVSNPKMQGKIVPSLAVATDDDWDDVLASVGGGSRRGRPAGSGKKKAARGRR